MTTTTKATTTTQKTTTTPKPATTAQVDYSISPYYPPIRDQGQCGSCWAFASISVLEYQLNKESNSRSYDLSEQQLVDCDYTNSGCDGGLPNLLFDDMIQYGFGILNETAYPYASYSSGTTGTCKSALKPGKFKVVSQTENSSGGLNGWGTATEAEIERVVRENGPVVAAISVPQTLFSYSSGIFNDCVKNSTPEHAITIVGFGERNGTKFWKIRNSWGKSWGQNGHFDLAKGKGACAINLFYAVPNVSLSV
jgi:C1A family cysteine protease